MTVALDCSKGCNFLMNEKSVGGSFTFSPTITNFSDGQQIQWLIKTASGSVNHAITPVTAIAPGYKFLGTATTLTMGAGDTAFFNWLVLGTNIIYSGGKL